MPAREWIACYIRGVRVGFVLLFVCAAQADDQQWRKTLERHGVRPTGASIGAYLRLHYAQGKKLQEIRKYLSYLEARDPVLRWAAARELARMAPAPLATIRSAESDDPDVRRWLNTLAEQMSAWIKPDVLDACFRTIHTRRLGGLAPEVLNLFPLCKADRLQSSASRALQATVGPQDVRMLVDALQGGSGRMRFAAALAYGALLKQDALPTLRAALRDKNEDLRVAAAHALANLGDRSCLRH